jgi:hypothetical protein
MHKEKSMRIVLLSIATLFIAIVFIGCPSQTPSSTTGQTPNNSGAAQTSGGQQTATPSGGSTNQVTPSPDGQNGNTSTQDGVTSTAGGASGAVAPSTLPEGWREDIPLMQGFTIENFAVLPNGGMHAQANGNVPVDSAYGYYSGNLPGWETWSDTALQGQTENNGSKIMTLRKDGFNLTISIMVEGNNTKLGIACVKQN